MGEIVAFVIIVPLVLAVAAFGLVCVAAIVKLGIDLFRE